MRLFVGLQIPDTWTRAAGELLTQVPVPARSLIEPIPPGRLHVTLRFVGECSQATAARLERELNQIGPIDVVMELSAADSFSAPGGLVIWLGVRSPQLQSLTKRIDEVISRVDPTPRDHPFLGHLSVARSVRELSADELRDMKEAVANLPPPPPLATPIHSAFLFDSDTTINDAYRIVSEIGS